MFTKTRIEIMNIDIKQLIDDDKFTDLDVELIKLQIIEDFEK